MPAGRIGLLSAPWRLHDLLPLSVGLDVLLVHVTRHAAELVRRERTRSDRDRDITHAASSGPAHPAQPWW